MTFPLENKKPVRSVEVSVPAFVFMRDDDLEASAGYFLAGDLIVDMPKHEEPDSAVIDSIVQQLAECRRLGQMPNNKAYVIGWFDGSKPKNAIDTDDEELMAAWAEDRICVGVRVQRCDHAGCNGLHRVSTH